MFHWHRKATDAAAFTPLYTAEYARSDDGGRKAAVSQVSCEMLVQMVHHYSPEQLGGRMSFTAPRSDAFEYVDEEIGTLFRKAALAN